MLAPVIQRALSEARNATTSATSSGLPIRFNACIPSAVSRPVSVLGVILDGGGLADSGVSYEDIETVADDGAYRLR